LFVVLNFLQTSQKCLYKDINDVELLKFCNVHIFNNVELLK